METRRDVFQAIADPTRRAIIELLAEQPLPVNAIAENFDVSRQAVSLHIKILHECGLILIRTKGRERHCQARPEKLQEVAKWVEGYRQFWEKRLDALESYLQQAQKKKRTVHKKAAAKSRPKRRKS